MLYEIPREEFKKRLMDKLNFTFIDLGSKTELLKDTTRLSYSESFASGFTATEGNKNKNIILFTLDKGDDSPKLAAEQLKEAGYTSVYYYRGEANDIHLDKGLN